MSAGVTLSPGVSSSEAQDQIDCFPLNHMLTFSRKNRSAIRRWLVSLVSPTLQDYTSCHMKELVEGFDQNGELNEHGRKLIALHANSTKVFEDIEALEREIVVLRSAIAAKKRTLPKPSPF